MPRDIRDQYLPPDHDAFLAASPSTGRIIVIAPTRAACETIEIGVGLELETFLLQTRGDELMRCAASGLGFGIVAGTGTGKTLAIRPIAQTLLGTTELRVGVVNREREATPDTPTWNVVIVTTGIARRWFQDGDITPRDTLVVDEIHQTSAELELCLALGKRIGCRYIWLSATVDPGFYARYLNSAHVLEVSAFDPTRAADVTVINKDPIAFLDDKFLIRVMKEKRGVGLFLPTRAAVEAAAASVAARFPRINAAYYHGGEPIRVIRPFLEEGVDKPFFLAMTAAGQSALNVRGLDTVVIDDTRFANMIERGINVLTKVHLGANEILQMAGRVHGRVEGGRVFILSDRDIHFPSLRPTAPDFQLAGDSERVALTCADLGVRADELDLPVELDKASYRRAVERLEARGVIENGRLSRYGKAVEALPVERAWAELIVHADDELIPYLAVMSSIESLHRMTREERNLDGLMVPGSDHLTAYNLYAEAFTKCGYLGNVYGLPRQLFDESVEVWGERRGVLVKSLEDAALAMASVYRAVRLVLPSTMPIARDGVHKKFGELLAQFMPFDLVVEERTADGREARVSRTSVCGSWGAVAGTLRYFADKFGTPRASIEGTQIPLDRIRRYATRTAPELVYDSRHKHAPLALRRRVEYFGFELEREVEPLDDTWPPALAAQARHAMASALARGEARHAAIKRNTPIVEQVREWWRRSGGAIPRFGLPELTAWYERQLAGANSIDDVRAAPLRLSPDEFVDAATRAQLERLPGAAEIRDRTVTIDYDVEEVGGGMIGVARLRLPEKIARSLTPAELPDLDRPIRFTVLRGQRGAVRAASLDELQEALDRPWSPDEVAAPRGDDDGARPTAERAARELASEFRKHRDRNAPHGERGGGGGPGGFGKNRGKKRRRR